MNRLAEIALNVVTLALILIVLGLTAAAACVRWVVMTMLQFVATIGLSPVQRVIMVRVCSFVSAQADKKQAVLIQKLMWLPGDRAPYHRPAQLLDAMDDRRRARYCLLSEARHGGIPAWRIRLARCVI